jgi:aspartate-semialdehyde dehydrogenase
MRVAVVGATGAVGREMTRTLEQRAFPVDEFDPLASSRSTGARVRFRDDEVKVGEASVDSLRGCDLALLSAGATVSGALCRDAAAAGVVCVDNSSAWRMAPDVPLVVPEVNAHALAGHHGIVANPNCTAITALMAVGPLNREFGLTGLVLSSYQSVSGSGMKGIRELAEQVGKLGADVESLVSPDHDALPAGEIYGRTIAFNVLALQGGMDEEDWTGEERKLLNEARKILDLPDLEVQATVVRVPVVTGHSVSIYATFGRSVTPEEARGVLERSPGVRLVDDPHHGENPTPLDAAGIDDVLVGRVRRAAGRDDGLLLFACGDNLRKGAALNAVQIAEALFTGN